MKRILPSLLVFLCLLLVCSCQSVKPYQRQYVNDSEMQMDSDAGQHFNLYIQSIREGSVSAKSSKGSGGCGCN